MISLVVLFKGRFELKFITNMINGVHNLTTVNAILFVS